MHDVPESDRGRAIAPQSGFGLLTSADAHARAVQEVCRRLVDVIGPQPAGLPGDAPAPADGTEAVRSFPAARESTRAARHFVLETLAAPEDHTLAVDAAIVTGELAANAVLHARSGFTVGVLRSAAGVRISVRDAAPLPTPSGHGWLQANHGHGLWVVAQVADAWAVQGLPDGKVVWAELPAKPR